jgi:hypothetical protein
MTAVATPVPVVEAPKLLLDTNVYLDLGDGLLSGLEKRLLAIAAHRTPPLFWACEIRTPPLFWACEIRGAF